VRVDSIGGIEVGVLEDAAKMGTLVAELSGEPPADYGTGRSCEWCRQRVHRFAAPHTSGVTLCSRCTSAGILPDHYSPEVPGKPSDAVKLERHRLASLARAASLRALRILVADEDAGDALDIAWDRLGVALEVGARPTAAARAYLDCLRELEALRCICAIPAAPAAPVQLVLVASDSTYPVEEAA
jgi:hypothetical protein